MKILKTHALACALACLLCDLSVGARGQEPGAQSSSPKDERLEFILKRVGESVERYHRGMFSIAFTETHRREELDEELRPKKASEFVYESVVLRQNLSDAPDDYFPQTVSRLKSVDGRPAKKGEAGASEPVSAHEDFLAFLLPPSQKLYEFTLEGEETLDDGRHAFRVAALRLGQGEPRVEWEGNSFAVFAPTRTSFWVDAETFDVLRVESHLVKDFEFEPPPGSGHGPFGHARKLDYKREDFSVRFSRVKFTGPEQTLWLPTRAEWLKVIEGARAPRLRTTISFTNYRRFVSGVKVVEDAEP